MTSLTNIELTSFEILRVLFFVSFLFYIISAVWGKKIFPVARICFILSFIFLTFNLSVRIYASGRAPFSNLYESLISFTWGLVLIYLFIEQIYRLHLLGLFASGIAFATIAYASVLPKQIEPLLPALQSHWLIFHVLCFVFAYGAFAISFGCGIIYLILYKIRGGKEEELPGVLNLKSIESLTYKIVAFAFPFMTLGIITGAIWANKAWGSYWSWDPKETWSLITWLVYLAFLHARYHYKWKGTITAIIAITGFLVVIFTYLGVNFFLSGLHSYAK